jgi:hypothetical protein
MRGRVGVNRQVSSKKPWQFYGLVLSVVLIGLAALMGGARWRAMFASKSHFTQCSFNKLIWCEPGSEQFAALVAQSLGTAIAKIERAQFAPFSEPIRVYTYANVDSFVLHSGSNPNLTGVVVGGQLHLSPVALTMPARLAPLVVHELSHLHLSQNLSMLSFNRLPGWFLEGLATTVSEGAGAENVSEHDALASMAEGQCIVPNTTTGWMGGGRGAPPGMRSHMFYRQSAMFVAYVQSTDKNKFMHVLQALNAGTSLQEAFASAYGQAINSLWRRFVNTSQTLFEKVEPGSQPWCAQP